METVLFRRLIPLSLGGLLFSRARFCFAGRPHSPRGSPSRQGRFLLRRQQRPSGGLALGLELLACRFELAVPCGKDFLLASGQLVGRGDVTQGAMQAPGVVMFDVSSDDLAGLFQRERASAWGSNR